MGVVCLVGGLVVCFVGGFGQIVGCLFPLGNTAYKGLWQQGVHRAINPVGSSILLYATFN